MHKYQVLRLIGRGGMGAVYEAVHCDLDKQVAVKTLLSGMSAGSGVYERFLREAQAASRLRHPHIIEVTDFDHMEEGMPFMVLEYLEGEDLAQHLDRVKRLTPTQALAIFRDVFSAVEAAHKAGIVHRDLKPQNIFLCRFGDRTDFPKVLDFGISKILDASAALTGSNAYMGTPNYMAPEQAEGRSGEVDVRSDVFALGSILYRSLGGVEAYPGDRVATVLYRIVHEEPPDLSEVNPSLPAAVVEAVRRAMSRDPEDRFSSVAQLAQAILPALGGRRLARATEIQGGMDPALEATIASAPDEPAPPPPRPIHQLRILAAVLVLIGALISVAALIHSGGGPGKIDPPLVDSQTPPPQPPPADL